MSNVSILDEYRGPNPSQPSMTLDELERRWKAIDEDSKDSRRAELLAEGIRRGLTQEAMGERLGVSQQYINYMLTFSRFLAWADTTTVVNSKIPLKSLTERKFRDIRKIAVANATLDDRHESAIFRLILDHINTKFTLQEIHATKYETVANALKKAALVNGRKYTFSHIVEASEQPPEVVESYLKTRESRPTYGIKLEKVGNTTWKLHPCKGRKIDLDELYSKIKDHLEALLKLGKMNQMRLDPSEISEHVIKIQRVFDEMGQ